ncbi:MAG: hypothetical protein OQK24_00135 [Magnetovibrio sp.]|nr:hypothetical protein [Magnetovibrio sp.]
MSNQHELFDDFIEEVFFTKKITLKTGRVLYAKDCGLKAFRICKRVPKQQQKG